ncbi:HCLS1-associated protein X-1 [Aplochiton taeniatus]
MSVFDLFRGLFGVPGGNYNGEGRRDPLFDDITRHDEDDNEEEEYGFYCNDYEGSQRDPFDNPWRFGFSFGPSGMRVQEPPVFGQVFREMEEIIAQLGQWERQPRDFGVPNIEAPPSLDKPERARGASRGNSLRDFMLKSSDDPPQEPSAAPPGHPRDDGSPLSRGPRLPSMPFHGLIPFSKFHDIWSGRPQRVPDEERREDGDLDSAVSSGGLDQILTPPPAQSPYQPKNRAFFQSVTVTKVVKPDGVRNSLHSVLDTLSTDGC